MSVLYPDLDFTNYPGTLDNIELKSNITNSTDAQLVQQIQTAIIAGDFSNASAIINANPQLNGKIFNANDYNQIRDAILALERFYKNDINLYLETSSNSLNVFSLHVDLLYLPVSPGIRLSENSKTFVLSVTA